MSRGGPGRPRAIIRGYATASAVVGGFTVTWNAAALAGAVEGGRKRQRLTNRALAKMLGISPMCFCRLQRGSLPEGDNLAAILYWLHLLPLEYVQITTVPAA